MDDGAPLTRPGARDDLYDSDFYAWGLQQAALLRTRRLGELDVENLAEEIESLSRREKRELDSRLTVLLLNLLKWRYQAPLRGSSWEATIRVQRVRVPRHLNENPSLRSRLTESMSDAYIDARIEATGETQLPISTFPQTCPWSFEQIMDEAYWPN